MVVFVWVRECVNLSVYSSKVTERFENVIVYLEIGSAGVSCL